MHSRIFQVSKEPIDKEDYIDESNYIYDHWFTNSVADYVSNSCYRDEDLKWFEDCYEEKGIKFGVDDNGEYLIIESKVKYFEKSFKRFKELLEKINSYDITGFTKGIDEFWELKNEYEEKYGFYIHLDGDELMTLDDFARTHPENVKFYIGGTIDYHF